MWKYLIILTFIFTLSSRSCLEVNSKSDNRISKNGRIIGGDAVEIHIRPYQISLRGRSIPQYDKVREHFCGGSIISSTIIITAAHCVIGSAPGQLFVMAGSNKRSGSDGIMTLVKEIITHEKYDSKILTSDIALLIVSPPLPLNNFTIRPIELDENMAQTGALATVSGWGKTENEEKPEILRQVQVPIIDSEICTNDYKKLWYPTWSISDDQICAGYRGIGGKDSCFMDSGGPLTINEKLVGIVSHGEGCALADYPGVYARVSYHMQWIREKIAIYQ